MKKLVLACLALALTVSTAFAQRNEKVVVDRTRETAERVFTYLNGCTPYTFVDAKGAELKDLKKLDAGSTFAKGDFWIMSYEWGVTYSGMLKLAGTMNDGKYLDYVYDRFNAIAEVRPYAVKVGAKAKGPVRLHALYEPRFLDDCGAMDAAMIKATLADPERSKAFREQLDDWFDFVMNKEYRLEDGILARNRPAHNSVWLDDMYMGIPPIAYRGALADAEGDHVLAVKYYEEAVNQILLFKKYLWVPEMNLFRHGWIEEMSVRPNYHWARCNGWAILTMCDVLDVIPEDTPGRAEVLELLQNFIYGVAAYQAPDGLWHQLIDRTESYLETSASAMFVYCIAHGILKGWLDKTAYQDVAKAGWRAVMKQVNDLGQVENTCVGTGLGWTNTFYEHRPVSVLAAHGYGPVLLAASEMLELMK